MIIGRIALKVGAKRMTAMQRRALKKAIAASAKKRSMKKAASAARLTRKLGKATAKTGQLNRIAARSTKRLSRAKIKQIKLNRKVDAIKNPSKLRQAVQKVTKTNTAAHQARRLEKATRLQLRAERQARKVERLAMKEAKALMNVSKNSLYIQKTTKNINKAQDASKVAMQLMKKYSK